MAHSLDAEAVDVPVTDVDSAAAAISETLEDEEQFEDELDEFDDEPEGEADDADPEDEFDDDDEQEEAEPEAVIGAPASLTAEEKASYSQLPPEAQQFVSQLESRRATQVQEATTKASEAQRVAEERAAAADAEARLQYANQLKQIGETIAPQMPDPSQYRDQQSYLMAEAQYRHAKAQHDEYMQQVMAVETEASEADRTAFLQARDRVLQQHPQISNPETRNDYITGVMGLASEAGLDPQDIFQNATGQEFLAIAKIFDRVKVAEEKAAKFDKLNKGKMQKVRAAKRSLRPGAAQSQGSGKRQIQTKSRARLRKSGSVEDAASAIANLR